MPGMGGVSPAACPKLGGPQMCSVCFSEALLWKSLPQASCITFHAKPQAPAALLSCLKPIGGAYAAQVLSGPLVKGLVGSLPH